MDKPLRIHNKPEIIAPMGSIEHLEVAVSCRADAVYIGVKGHSSRPDAASFDLAELSSLIPMIKSRGLKCYLAINAEMRDRTGVDAKKLLLKADTLNSDALILGDIGMIAIASELNLKTALHASSLIGVMNADAAKMLTSFEVKRIVLPTCLTIQEIAELIERSPAIEFELIIFNGVCFNDSWRCGLAHSYSAISGFDVQCKHHFSVEAESADINLADKQLLWTPDIDCSNVIPLLWSLGVTSFKIEGRTQKPSAIENAVKRVYRAVESIDLTGALEFPNPYHYLVHTSYLLNNNLGSK